MAQLVFMLLGILLRYLPPLALITIKRIIVSLIQSFCKVGGGGVVQLTEIPLACSYSFLEVMRQIQ